MPAVVPFWSLLKTKCDAEKMASCSGHCCPEIRIFSKSFKKKKKASCREASSYMHKIYMNVT